MTSEEPAKKMQQIVAKAWSDEDFKQRLLSDPKKILQQEGIDVPAGLEMRIVENTEKISYFVLPRKPTEGELDDVELENVAGGGASMSRYGTCIGFSAACNKDPR